MPERDRRGGKPGAPKPDLPWLKDRPDLHRTEEKTEPPGSGEAQKPPEPEPEERPPKERAPDKRGADQRVPGSAQRVPGSERGAFPPQPAAPAAQGNATKARRRPS